LLVKKLLQQFANIVKIQPNQCLACEIHYFTLHNSHHALDA